MYSGLIAVVGVQIVIIGTIIMKNAPQLLREEYKIMKEAHPTTAKVEDTSIKS